jgi:hypothetical protein
MAEIDVDDGALLIALTATERMLALRRRDLVVPLTQVSTVVPVERALGAVRGWRVGSAWPGRFAMGTWHGRVDGVRFRDFVLVHSPGPGVVLSLDGGEYDRIVFDYADPDQFVAAVRA